MRYMQTLNTGSLFYATLNAIAYFYMVSICTNVACALVTLYILISTFILFHPFRFALGEATHLLLTLFQCMCFSAL